MQSECDAKGHLTATVDPTGARTTIAYNSFGQPTSTTDPLGNITTFTYDDFGNLMTITDPLGNRTQRAYDLVSRLIEQTDPRGRSARFTYDGLNRITRITDALADLTQFAYDGNGNLLTVTDARESTITHTYDVMDRLATRTDPVAAVESFAYDGAGNLTRHTDRKGQVNTFSYDALNRRIGGSYADGATTSFVYDAAGRLTEATDSVGGTILNAYDNLDRLIAQTAALGTVNYQYDALGRRTQMDVTGQAPVAYAYDAASRLTQVVQGIQIVDLQYDALGRRTRLTLPNGVSTEYQYDTASRLTALIYRNALGFLGDLIYQYDAAGNRISTGGSFARTLLPDPVASAATTYDAANRQLQFGDKTMTFDANGNLTSITDTSGLTTLTWDARNRLVGLVGPGTTASFNYNALGDRISKSVNGDTTSFQLDGVDVVKEIQGNSEIHYLRSLAIDEPLVQTDATASRYQLRDGLNSSVAVVDTSGGVAAQYSYDPFGQTVVSGGTSSNPFQFTGRENDGTGIYYYRARYYSPSLMRFLTEDPIGLLADSVNFYAYVFNNPLNLTDPSGKVVPIVALVAIGAGIGGTANALSYFLTTPAECREVGKLAAAFGVGALAGGAGALAGAGFATVATSAAGLGVFTSNVVGGIANGLVSQGVQDVIHGQASAPLTYVFSAGANALGGGLASRIPGLRLGGRHPGVDATTPVPEIDFIPWRYGRYFGPNSARVLAQEAFANTVAGGLETGMQALSGSAQCKK